MSSKKIIRVGDVMRTEFIIVDGMETVAGAIAKMKEADTDIVIVDKRSDDDEYGVVPLTVIVSKVLAENRPAQRLNAYEIMLKPAVMVDASMDVRYCARFFSNLGIRTAPVLRNNEIVGTISYRELAFGGWGARVDN